MCRIKLSVVLVVSLVMLVGATGLALAQVRATGLIQGTVMDNDALPLPGVQVTASSPALIGEQVVYTSTDGGYRLNLLPPGVYRLIFSLNGFSTVVREEIEVGVQRTTTANIMMTISMVEEIITVTGRSPLVDIRSTKRSTEISDDFLNSLPEPRFGGGSQLQHLSPDASFGASGGASFFGSSTASNSFQIDGATVTDPNWGSQFPFYSPDWFDVIEQTTTGGSADFGKAMGSVFNVVTKSGGNSYHGEFNYLFQNNRLVDDNTEDVTSEVAEIGPPQVPYHHDFTANLGGPVKRDELWFFAGYQAYYESFRSSTATSDAVENSDRFFGKLTWQANHDNRFIVSVMADTYTFSGRPTNALTEPEAKVEEPSMNITPNITWNSVLSPDSFLEIKYSGFYGFFDLIPITDAAASYDWGSGVLSDAYWGYYTSDRTRTNVQGNLTYYVEDLGGDHAFKFGGEWESLMSKDLSTFGSNEQGEHILYYPYWGEPYVAYTQDPGVDHRSSQINVTTIYAQDDWTVGNRLTLNLGLRFDHWNIGWVDGERDDAPTFNDLAPRLGATFDVLGDGRASAHVFWGRFYEEAHGAIFDPFDPNRAAWLSWYWGGTQWFRDPAFDFDPKEGLAIDTGLRNAFSNQFAAGLDYQLVEHLALGFKYVHKSDDNIIGAEDQGSTFVPIEVEAANGEIIDMWAADPWDELRVLVNSPNSAYVGDSYRKYNGFQVKMNKRLSNNWALQSSFMIQKAEGNVDNTGTGVRGSTTAFLTPNAYVNTPGDLRNTRRYVFKANGSYLLPDPIRVLVGFRVDWAHSGRWSIFERFPTSVTNGLRVDDRTIAIEPIGSRTIDNRFNIDLRLEKKFKLPGAWGDLGVIFDIFNLTNSNSIGSIWQRVPNWGEPTWIVWPRNYVIGTRWLF